MTGKPKFQEFSVHADVIRVTKDRGLMTDELLVLQHGLVDFCEEELDLFVTRNMAPLSRTNATAEQEATEGTNEDS